ncbi:hypothetical protein QBC36DRAFT_129055 [Triangularia setosa]|uniref:Uncharacterized protein n=1 Tax=Triangularia setosa TaxID=2587417 RepID=A0AAN7ACK8_9PEZI|nr:hypothetical protein QBC36DRAFT_129055 [Podospora setosa]
MHHNGDIPFRRDRNSSLDILGISPSVVDRGEDRMGFMLQEGYVETCARTGRETRFWPTRRERSDRTQSNILKRLLIATIVSAWRWAEYTLSGQRLCRNPHHLLLSICLSVPFFIFSDNSLRIVPLCSHFFLASYLVNVVFFSLSGLDRAFVVCCRCRLLACKVFGLRSGRSLVGRLDHHRIHGFSSTLASMSTSFVQGSLRRLLSICLPRGIRDARWV